MKILSTILLAGSVLFGTVSHAKATDEHKQYGGQCKAKMKEICKTDKEKCQAIKEKKKALKKEAKESCKNAGDKKTCMREYKKQHIQVIKDMIDGTEKQTAQTK